MANQQMKRCLTLFAFREMRFKMKISFNTKLAVILVYFLCFEMKPEQLRETPSQNKTKQKINLIHCINRIKNKNYMIISIFRKRI